MQISGMESMDFRADRVTCLRFSKKLKNTRVALREWNKNIFGHCDQMIDNTMKELDLIQEDDPTMENALKENGLLGKLDEYLFRKDIIWKQKLRELWLRDGDRNTTLSTYLSIVMRSREN